jgi:hypothetical protein
VPTAEIPDARALRFEQGAIAVILLVGFVFRTALLVPVTALVVLAAVLFGPQGNVLRLGYDAAFKAHAGVDRTGEAPEVTRVTRIVEAVLLVLGSVFVLIGVTPMAWLLALPVAAITGIAATTGVNLVAMVRDRGTSGRSRDA